METRLLVAYGLVALLGVASATAAIVTRRRSAARKRRLRGIKTPPSKAARLPVS